MGGALAAGSAAGLASRLAGRGSGTSIRGKLLLKLAPDALDHLLPGRTIACVSGTNGKTTTTHLLTAALRACLPDHRRVVTNADGANLHHGIASALAMAPKADVAILETDERVVPDVVRLGHPAVLVLLNFSRDQMDRHHEIKALGRGWRQALEAAGADGPVVVANADDPLIVWAAQPARRVVWVDTSTTWTDDATLCPECGTVLRRSPGPDGVSRWVCPTGDLAQPPASYAVDGNGVLNDQGERWELNLQVPGSFNISNAACALAAAVELGVDPDTAVRAMRTVTSPAGRYATTSFGSTTARLLLAKNPAGWAGSLPLATSQTVVLAIDSAAADGRDVSWLWDVDYEQLAGRHVVATGPRAQDLSVRLLYAGVEHTVVPDLAEAVADHSEPVDVIATYTPFQRLRKLGGLV
ncbi:MAG: MurT ligase domain-containing protein [Actinomycetia bacterium]|nr:MurT ligase domain-containing protein [Actinomycetes bacterium]